MKKDEMILWILKIAVAGEFMGHGIFALEGKKDWIMWIVQLIGVTSNVAAQLLMVVGLMDVIMALVVVIKPVGPMLLWMTFWGFWTALVRPLVGLPVWDFVERWANWGAPLALYLLSRQPKSQKA